MPAQIAVLYEDPWIIAVDKPAGIIVHGDGTDSRTLTDLVRDVLLERGDAAAARDLQALQRLDRDTSGIVLFSKSKETQPAFDRLIEQRAIHKRYLAIVEGTPRWHERAFTFPIGRDRHDARRMRVSRTGKPSCTEATVIASSRGRTLLSVDLKTGRKHQIRVHLSHAGFPILGDVLYGHPSHSERERGLMLHAADVCFTHPVTEAEIQITAETPPRFAATMK